MDGDRNVSLEVLNALCEALEVSLMDIMTDNAPDGFSAMADVETAFETLRKEPLTQRELSMIVIKLHALIETRGQWPVDED